MKTNVIFLTKIKEPMESEYLRIGELGQGKQNLLNNY